MKILLLTAVAVSAVLLVWYFAVRHKGPVDDSARVVFRDAPGSRAEELRSRRVDRLRQLGDRWQRPRSTTRTGVAFARSQGRRGRRLHARLELFAQAHQAAPEWPYPVYETAVTCLLQVDMERAEGEYEVVERLAPHGFFTYQPELDCIRRERKGEFPPGTCRTYVPIADAPESAENRAALEKLLERSPCLAPAWQKLSNMLDDDDARLSAIEKGLACHPDPQTRGYLLVNKALIIHRRGKDDEAISMPGDVALDPQSPPDNQPIAKQTLAFILAEPKAR